MTDPHSPSPDGRWIATTSLDATVRVWEAATGKLAATLIGHLGYSFRPAFSPDGHFLATRTDQGTLRIWDSTSWRCDRRTLHVSPLWHFAVGGGSAETAFFDAQLGCIDAEGTLFEEHTGLVVDRSDREQSILGLARRTTPRGFYHPSRLLQRAADGRLVVMRDEDDTHVVVRDVRSGEVVSTLPTGAVRQAALDRSGRILVSVSVDGDVYLWDLRSSAPGERVRTVADAWVAYPDLAGERLLVCGEVESEIVDLRGKAAPIRLAGIYTSLTQGFDARTPPQWAPDGTSIAALADSWATPALWSAVSGERLTTFVGHTDRVTSIAFHPDGTRIVTASEDETVRLWDVETGRQLLCLRDENGWGAFALFSPDGSRLVSDHGTLRQRSAAPTSAQAASARALLDELDRAREEVPDLIETLAPSAWRTLVPPDLPRTARLARAIAISEYDADRRATMLAAVESLEDPAVDSASVDVALRLTTAESERFPNSVSLRRAQGMALYRAGRCAQAALALESVRDDDKAGLAFLAMAYSRLGSRAEALATLERLREATLRLHSESHPVQLLVEAQAVFAEAFPDEH